MSQNTEGNMQNIFKHVSQKMKKHAIFIKMLGYIEQIGQVVTKTKISVDRPVWTEQHSQSFPLALQL